jgi:hypothetical protein
MKILVPLIAFGLTALASATKAEDRAFVITNSTGKTITGFYVTPASGDASTLNMVGSAGIEPQGLLDINVPSATDACLFDLRITFGDATEENRADVDICNTDGYIVE